MLDLSWYRLLYESCITSNFSTVGKRGANFKTSMGYFQVRGYAAAESPSFAGSHLFAYNYTQSPKSPIQLVQDSSPRSLSQSHLYLQRKMSTETKPQNASSSSSPKFTQSTALRKASAIGMIILLYTAATPFSPIVWLTTELEGSFFLDRLLAGVLLFSALYFQWRISKQEFPVAICLPTSTGRQTISNGNITQTSSEFVWLYRPTEYWKYVGTEAAMLGVAEFGNVEIVRRGVVSGVIAVLWAVGWFVTPESVKREGWEYVKRIWFWIALDEIMRIGSRGAGRRSRW
jgi:hypothetical protein